MKVIFLDLDGPICYLGQPQKDAIYCLTELIRLTGAKIVITSSRRIGKTLDQVTSQLSLWTGFPSESVIELLDVIYSQIGYEISRGAEIEIYLRNHPEVENYVILDDLPIVLLSQVDNFVQITNPQGITGENFREALRILG